MNPPPRFDRAAVHPMSTLGRARKRFVRRVIVGSLCGAAWWVCSLPGCVTAECSTPDYRNPECRVIAENDAARLWLPRGVEIRFQDPDADEPETWTARGRLRWHDDEVRARVAGLGPFAISLVSEADDAVSFRLVLENVARDADVRVGDVVVRPESTGLRRRIDLQLSAGATTWIRGDISCPSRYRLALAADIQTNPDQFRRIVEQLGRDAAGSADTDPVLGMILAGDLSESSRVDEFEVLEDMFSRAPAPVAVTAGNHDTYDPEHSRYNDHFGPGNHTFTVCGTKVVLLDSGSGVIADSIDGRLPELLGRDGASRLVVALHHPPYAGHTGAGWSHEDRAQSLLVEAALADVDLIVAGHKHSLLDFPAVRVGDRTVRELVVGTGGATQGSGRPTYGYVRLTVDRDEDRFETCFVRVPPPGDAPDDPSAPLPESLPACP